MKKQLHEKILENASQIFFCDCTRPRRSQTNLLMSLHQKDTGGHMRQRVIVCPVIENNGAILLCKMAGDRGVFPGQWALSGGGMEPGENIEQALRREIAEELGDELQITDVQPWTFRDDVRIKTYADGSKEEIYMIYLMFDCTSANRQVTFNEEFQETAWVKPADLHRYDLNEATRETFTKKGWL